MTTQEFLKGALSKAASTATRLVPQIKPAVAVAKGVMNEVSKTPPVQPVQVLKTAANMAVNTNPAVAVAKSLYTPTAAGAKSAVSSLATAMKPAQAAPVAGPVYNGPVQNARPPVATQNPSPAIRPPVPANPPGQSALSTPGAGFTSTDPTIRAQVEAMSRSAAQPTAPIRPPVVSTPDIKSLSMAAVSNNDRLAQIKALNDAYTRSLQLSPEEEAKQQQLDAISQRQALLRQSYNEGDSNIRNQAIPMQFVTGQQAALQRQYTNQQEGIAAESLPLKDQLALLQQRRAANQAAAKANLDFEQAQYKTEQEKSKPVEVGGSLIQYDPNTGTYKTLFSKPQEVAKPEIREANGVIYERQNDGTWKSVAGSPKTDTQQPEVKTINGQSAQWDAGSNSWVPVSLPVATSPEKTQKAQEVLSLAQDLLNSSSLGNAVGPISSKFPTFSGDTADFEAKTNRLKSLLTLENLGLLKGAMSDKDLELLSSAASALSTGMSEQGFKTELQNIVNKMNGVISGGAAGQSVESYAQSKGFSAQEVQGLRSRGRTDEQIRQLIDSQGFNNAATVQAKNGSTLVSKNPNPTKIIRTGSGTYDFSNYATDPNWGNAVKSHLSKIPNTTDPAQLTSYIKSQAPNSPITGEMVLNSARKFGVDPKIILAIAKQEANYATLGRAARTFNPGNVGNVDSGSNVNWGSWQAGLDALARNISRRSLA